ncbi:hypothetical protein RRF57_013242 [Xylaria bambusicola]|uniref:Uncharacterized protein n=1 Tax=Xylaria bambusicola TaxID=326684 RepID=A0AAN7UWH4_9PEZI
MLNQEKQATEKAKTENEIIHKSLSKIQEDHTSLERQYQVLKDDWDVLKTNFEKTKEDNKLEINNLEGKISGLNVTIASKSDEIQDLEQSVTSKSNEVERFKNEANMSIQKANEMKDFFFSYLRETVGSIPRASMRKLFRGLSRNGLIPVGSPQALPRQIILYSPRQDQEDGEWLHNIRSCTVELMVQLYSCLLASGRGSESYRTEVFELLYLIS